VVSPTSGVADHAADLLTRVGAARAHDLDHPALIDDHGALTYGALIDRVEAVAAVLADLGVARGERVASLGTTRGDVFVTLLACARLGALLVPLNLRLATAELDWMLDDCAVTAIVGDDELLDRLAHRGEPRLGFAALTDRANAALCDGRRIVADPSRGRGADELMVVYTSGTTGRPKGAVLTQSAIVAHAENAIDAFGITADDRTLVALPLFHVGGLNVTATPTLLCGGTVCCHGRFDPQRWLIDVEQLRPATSVLVPAMLDAVIRHPAFAATDLSSLRYLVSGSSIIPDQLMEAFLDRGVPTGQVYGLTETGPIATAQPVDEVFDRVGSSGFASPNSEIRISGAGGLPAGVGEPGEVLVRGGNVFSRYWNRPEDTAAAFVGGWFRTGDIGSLDAEGRLTIHSRMKEMIISGGENVYPAELEAVLADDPRIAESAVVGRPDERWGEVPVAVVVSAPGASLTADDVLALFTDRLARYKHPKAVQFVDALPRNAMGKVRKSAVVALVTR